MSIVKSAKITLNGKFIIGSEFFFVLYCYIKNKIVLTVIRM